MRIRLSVKSRVITRLKVVFRTAVRVRVMAVASVKFRTWLREN